MSLREDKHRLLNMENLEGGGLLFIKDKSSDGVHFGRFLAQLINNPLVGQMHLILMLAYIWVTEK